MAAVHGPPIPSHPDSFQKATNGPAHNSRSRLVFPHQPNLKPLQPPPPPGHTSQVPGPSKPDPFYGHEHIARLCARFITHLFVCPEYPPTATHSQAKLPYFIAYALHRTKLHSSVTFAALVLLQRLKARFPTARGSSGHRLFISAFMIASKVICDDTYSNKSWGIVAQGLFNLREINQMEREMCSYLEWELTVDNSILSNFETLVKRDFCTPGPYPTYSLQMVSRKANISPSSYSHPSHIPPPNSSTSPIPSFGQRHPSPPKPIHPPPPPGTSSSSHPSYGTPPATPDTPSSCSSSTSTSPTSTASPRTPAGIVDLSAQIASYDTSPGLSIRTEKAPPIHPLKAKMYAFAIPSVW
jgi:hypothetical protein